MQMAKQQPLLLPLWTEILKISFTPGACNEFSLGKHVKSAYRVVV